MLTAEEYVIEYLGHTKEEYEFLRKLIIDEEKRRRISDTWVPGTASVSE